MTDKAAFRNGQFKKCQQDKHSLLPDTVSGFFAAWWWAVLAGLAVTGVLTVLALRRPVVRAKVDRVILRLPVFGPMAQKVEVARIARTLGAMLAGGVRILEGLRVTGQSARNLAIRSTFTDIIQRVSSGEPLAEAMAKAKVYPAMMISLIRTGEETGELPEMLAELSEVYEDEAERAINAAVKLLEPLLIVLVGGVIASIVAAVMLPIFEVNAAGM